MAVYNRGHIQHVGLVEGEALQRRIHHHQVAGVLNPQAGRPLIEDLLRPFVQSGLLPVVGGGHGLGHHLVVLRVLEADEVFPVVRHVAHQHLPGRHILGGDAAHGGLVLPAAVRVLIPDAPLHQVHHGGDVHLFKLLGDDLGGVHMLGVVGGHGDVHLKAVGIAPVSYTHLRAHETSV